MNVPLYFLSREACRFVKSICIRQRVLFAERVESQRPALLAVSHISHLEPVFVTLHLRRPIRWMTRIEFYRSWWGRLMLDRCGAFQVDRYGFSLPSVRTAIRLLSEGQTVGIFPEGGVATGCDSVMRGGQIKRGVCTIAIRASVPVVPVVVLGTDRLNCVKPWLPAKRGEVWIAYGQPIIPPARPHRTRNRAVRFEFADQIQEAFGQLYQELLSTEQLADSRVP